MEWIKPGDLEVVDTRKPHPYSPESSVVGLQTHEMSGVVPQVSDRVALILGHDKTPTEEDCEKIEGMKARLRHAKIAKIRRLNQ